MLTELINTGTELMLGRVLNTHQQWLCNQLSALGHLVSRQIAVPDTPQEIQTAVRESLTRADLVIVTGGLGPTSDDLTRDHVASLLGKKLREDPGVLGSIQQFFSSLNRAMPDRTRVQAMVPEGAIVLRNDFGTAPGLALEVNPNAFRADRGVSWLIMLPGPPRELRPMFTNIVAPLLARVLPPESPFVCRTLRSTGIGESIVEQTLEAPLRPLLQKGLQIGYCARPGQVDIRLSARGPEAGALVAEAEALVRAPLSASIYSTEEEEIEAVIVRLLTERKQTLALAESCTGGCVGNRITDVPGASAVLLAGFVTYSNKAKQDFLGVLPGTLAEQGAVSKAVAKQMAEGARQRAGADYGLSLTGIAGPSGGSVDKPVGTVYMALATSSGTTVERHFNPWDRSTFKQASAQQALNLLRRRILQLA